MRSCIVTILIGVLLTGAMMTLHKTWPDETGFEPEDRWTYFRILQEEEQRAEKLEEMLQQVKQRLEFEAGMIHRLIAEEITLADAVDRLRCGRTPAELAVFLDQLRAHWKRQSATTRPSDEELLCRNVIARVERQLLSRPDARDKIITRLDGEMSAYLREQGAGPRAETEARREAASSNRHPEG
jgi:hypothetical protein